MEGALGGEDAVDVIETLLLVVWTALFSKNEEISKKGVDRQPEKDTLLLLLLFFLNLFNAVDP